VRIEEEIGQHIGFTAIAKLQLTILFNPSALPHFLIFPLFWIADTRLCLHIVPPHVFGAFPIRPYILAGDSTGIAANALFQVERHTHL
jgi:hypothetical protein